MPPAGNVGLRHSRFCGNSATAREESTRACPHSRRGLTPLGRLQKYPKKHVSTPVFFPGESHGQRSLTGYSPPGYKELDVTEATEHARILVCFNMCKFLYVYIHYAYCTHTMTFSLHLLALLRTTLPFLHFMPKKITKNILLVLFSY